jgi:hypothetical protein
MLDPEKVERFKFRDHDCWRDPYKGSFVDASDYDQLLAMYKAERARATGELLKQELRPLGFYYLTEEDCMTLKEADDKAHKLFGDDTFCAIDYAGRCQIFYREDSPADNCIMLGRGGDWDEAFADSAIFAQRFYPALPR